MEAFPAGLRWLSACPLLSSSAPHRPPPPAPQKPGFAPEPRVGAQRGVSPGALGGRSCGASILQTLQT